MKKKVLAMFMAALVTVGTVLAPVETGSVYAAQITEEQTEEITPETETELQKEVQSVRKLKPKLGRSRLTQRTKIQKMRVRRSRKPV